MDTYLITEGLADAVVMRTLLGEADLRHVRVMEAGGKSSAVSLGTSLALNGRARAAILVDSDTTEPNRVEEQKLLFRDLQRDGVDPSSCKLFLAVPTLEGELFPTAEAFASAFGLKLNRRQADKYRSHWSSVVKSFVSRPGDDGLATLPVGPTAPTRSRDLWSKPLLADLLEFLRSGREQSRMGSGREKVPS
jgi:hypothetical protein